MGLIKEIRRVGVKIIIILTLIIALAMVAYKIGYDYGYYLGEDLTQIVEQNRGGQ